MTLPKQTLLSFDDLTRLGLCCCGACGAGHTFGELCIYEEGDNGQLTSQSIWCRDCETGTTGNTFSEAAALWNAANGAEGEPKPDTVVLKPEVLMLDQHCVEKT